MAEIPEVHPLDYRLPGWMTGPKADFRQIEEAVSRATGVDLKAPIDPDRIYTYNRYGGEFANHPLLKQFQGGVRSRYQGPCSSVAAIDLLDGRLDGSISGQQGLNAIGSMDSEAKLRVRYSINLCSAIDTYGLLHDDQPPPEGETWFDRYQWRIIGIGGALLVAAAVVGLTLALRGRRPAISLATEVIELTPAMRKPAAGRGAARAAAGPATAARKEVTVIRVAKGDAAIARLFAEAKPRGAAKAGKRPLPVPIRFEYRGQTLDVTHGNHPQILRFLKARIERLQVEGKYTTASQEARDTHEAYSRIALAFDDTQLANLAEPVVAVRFRPAEMDLIKDLTGVDLREAATKQGERTMIARAGAWLEREVGTVPAEELGEVKAQLVLARSAAEGTGDKKTVEKIGLLLAKIPSTLIPKPVT